MAIEPDEVIVDSDEDQGGPVKTFFEHLEDLRWVLIRSAVAIGICMLLCLIAGDWLVGVLKWPLGRASIDPPGTNQVVNVLIGTNVLSSGPIGTNQLGHLALPPSREVTLRLASITLGTNQLLTFLVETNAVLPKRTLAEQVQLLNLNPAGGFVVAFQVAIYGGLLLAAPFVLFYIGSFILPALRRDERRYLLPGFAIGTFLFISGVLFCYFVMLPLALRASVKYSEWLGFSANQWRAEEYISFVCKFLLGMGLGFELPVIILSLVKLGILSYQQLAGFRRYMLCINLILGAVLTTPEVLTQVMMALPLQVLYEISVWIAWYWERRDRKREAQS